MTFKTISDVRYANEQGGYHFFDRKSMRFFASRIVSALYGGRFFITSEKTGFDSTRRAYTVRRAGDNGDINTVGEFNGYRCIEDAREAARDAVREEAANGKA